MLTVSEEDIRFLAENYQPACFDVSRAIKRYYRGNHFKSRGKKWLLTVISSAACAAVAFAGGYSLALSIQKDRAEKAGAAEQQSLPATADMAAELTFEDTPIAEVLSKLSEAYGSKLSTAPTDKRLTASFSQDDGLEYVISLIEAALDITITVEK